MLTPGSTAPSSVKTAAPTAVPLKAAVGSAAVTATAGAATGELVELIVKSTVIAVEPTTFAAAPVVSTKSAPSVNGVPDAITNAGFCAVAVSAPAVATIVPEGVNPPPYSART